MDADVARRAFDPFFTTRRGSGGSGLGLHVVHNLVTQLLAGDIELRTAPGEGTALILRFPAVTPESPRAAGA
jgi:signal transduction histidine kinase